MYTNNAPLRGNPSKSPYICCLFDPSKIGNFFMTPDVSTKKQPTNLAKSDSHSNSLVTHAVLGCLRTVDVFLIHGFWMSLKWKRKDPPIFRFGYNPGIRSN